MKKILFWCAGLVILMASCNSNTYSDKRKAEDKLIANYISRNGLNIISELPADSVVWGEKDYYKVEGYDNLYFHLNKRGAAKTVADGDTIDNQILRNETIVVRYKRYALTENADTTSYWSTLDNAYPLEFKYGSDLTNACTGWQEAVRLMKYPNSECVLICPSKQGFDADNSSVTPYGYILNIKVKR